MYNNQVSIKIRCDYEFKKLKGGTRVFCCYETIEPNLIIIYLKLQLFV